MEGARSSLVQIGGWVPRKGRGTVRLGPELHSRLEIEIRRSPEPPSLAPADPRPFPRATKKPPGLVTTGAFDLVAGARFELTTFRL